MTQSEQPRKRKFADDIEQVKKTAKEASKIYRIAFVIFNLAYIIAYSVFIVISMSRKNAEITWLPYLLIAFTAAYFVAFVTMIAMGKDNKKLKASVKDYKSTFKIMKLCLKLFNLLLTVSMVFNAVYNDRSLFSLILAAVSIPYVIFQIISSIRKIVKRKRQAKIAERKSSLRKGLVADVRNIISDAPATTEAPSAQPSVQQATAETAVAVAADDTATSAVPEEQQTQPAKAPKKGISAKIEQTKKKAEDKIASAKQLADKGSKVLDRVNKYRKEVKEVESGKKKKTDK